MLGAEVARHYKPQREAYLTTADLLGLPPEQCLMVAAHNGDLAKASRGRAAHRLRAAARGARARQTKDVKPAQRRGTSSPTASWIWPTRLGC